MNARFGCQGRDGLLSCSSVAGSARSLARITAPHTQQCCVDVVRVSRMLLGLAILWLCTGSMSASAAELRLERLKTLDGREYEDVRVTAVRKDYVLAFWKGGGGTILLVNIPDEMLKKLGLPTREERERAAREENDRLQREAQERLERERKFEEDQRNKGLVKYKDKWMTPAQMEDEQRAEREKDITESLGRLLTMKSRQGAVYMVVQALQHGLLCRSGRWSSYYKAHVFDGDFFFLYGASRATTAEGDKYTDDLFWAGTYTYRTVDGTERTVNSYALHEKDALALLRAKLRPDDRENKGAGAGPAEPAGVRKPQSYGSGFVITADGHVLTNHHVVKAAKEIEIKHEDKTLPAKVIASDPDNDIAILKMEGKFEAVSFSPEATATLGQTVFAVGFPLPTLQGLSAKVTKGVVSSLRGFKDNIREYQVDLSVQPGNSGGPLADEYGHVVGVIFARLDHPEAENVNYAIKRPYLWALIESVPGLTKAVSVARQDSKPTFEDAVSKVQKATVQILGY